VKFKIVPWPDSACSVKVSGFLKRFIFFLLQTEAKGASLLLKQGENK